jgi:putative transposase
MRHAQLSARARRRNGRTTDSRHAEPIAPNLLQRSFQTDAPNLMWVADSTYLPTCDGWLEMAVVPDLFARRVVGWLMQPALKRGLVLAALEHALQRRQPLPGLHQHSNRGIQYANAKDQALMAQAQMRSSINRTGNCWDSAASYRQLLG